TNPWRRSTAAEADLRTTRTGRLRRHLVGATHGLDLGPYLGEPLHVGDRPAHGGHSERGLLVGHAGLAVVVDRPGREVTHEDVEDLVDDRVVELGDRRLFENELAVDDEREHLGQGE